MRLQDDASSIVHNHVPSTYRTKLTSWYAPQKTQLTNMVNTMLKVDEGIYQIQFKQSGKLLAPQGGSTTSGALVQQTDQLWGNTAAQWKVMLNGTLRQIINVKSGQCLDLQTNTTGATNIVQRACNGSSTQGFRLAQMAAGVLSIRSATNQALQIPNSSTANGANLVQGTVAGQAPEQFVFMPNGGGASQIKLLETATAVYSLKFKHSNMGLAVSSMSMNDGVSVVQQPYSATDDRFHWYITQHGTWRRRQHPADGVPVRQPRHRQVPRPEQQLDGDEPGAADLLHLANPALHHDPHRRWASGALHATMAGRRASRTGPRAAALRSWKPTWAGNTTTC